MRFALVLVIILAASCGKNDYKVAFHGETMGTFYQVQYTDPKGRNFNEEIDSVLHEVNALFSTFWDESLISHINRRFEPQPLDPVFREVLEQALTIAELSGGYFDPTLYPLVSYWGFAGKEQPDAPDSAKIDSILDFIGYDLIQITDDNKLRKKDPRVQLDLNAIAKGFGVDRMGLYLESRGIENYMVNIGGDIRARGKNDREKTWRVGIEKPKDGAIVGEELIEIIRLYNLSMATSGDYRNFYMHEGVKYAHIIDPHTGFPGRSRVLSATMIHESCMIADAYATTAVAMGLEKALKILDDPDAPVYYLVYLDENDDLSVAMSDIITKWIVEF